MGKPVLSLLFLLLANILAACGAGATNQVEVISGEPPVISTSADASPTPAPESTTPPTIAPNLPAPLDPTAPGRATYSGILDEAITLIDGQYQGEPFMEDGASRPTVTLLTDPIAYGDLDGDGQDDAAVLLVYDSGGSGSFLYLAVVATGQDEPANAKAIFLGDRTQVRKMSTNNGQLLADLLTHAPDDPACCPTMETAKVFRLRDGELIDETPE